jgi:hypothetical protein
MKTYVERIKGGVIMNGASTSLQILKSEIEFKINTVQESEDFEGRITYVMALEGVLRNITNLLEVEQEQIEQAYFDGCHFEDNGFGVRPTEYFEQIFKTKK